MMQRIRGLVLTLLAVTPAVAGAQAIDQQQVYPYNMGALTYNSDWQGQTFMPTQSTSIGGAFRLSNTSTYQGYGGTLYMQLWTKAPDDPTRTFVASGSTTYGLGPQSNDWVKVFWDQGSVAVTPNTLYFLAMTEPNSPINPLVVNSDITGFDAYANGNAWYDWYGQTENPNEYERFVGRGYATIDYEFQEYYASDVAPEPASAALLATGLFALAAWRRRRGASV